jgi:hypothetical protein
MSGICLLHCTFVLARNPTLGVSAFGGGLVWHFVKGPRPLALWPPQSDPLSMKLQAGHEKFFRGVIIPWYFCNAARVTF